MKIISLPFITLLFSFSAFSQSQYIGITEGINPANEPPYGNPPKTLHYGFSGGFTYDNILKKHVCFGAGLLYEVHGINTFQPPFTTTVPYQSGDFIEDQRWEYISLPLKAGYRMGHRFFGFVNVGIIPAYFERGFLIDGSTSEGYHVTDVSKNFGRFDLGGLGEIGCGYQFTDRLSGIVSVIYEQSFFNEAYAWMGGTTFSAGIKYKFKKS